MKQPKIKYAIYLSTNPYADNIEFLNNDYGFWNGKVYCEDKVLKPSSSEFNFLKTKLFNRGYDAKRVAQSLYDKCVFVKSFRIVAINEKGDIL